MTWPPSVTLAQRHGHSRRGTAAATTPTTVVGTPTSPTAIDQQQLVPLNTMLAAAADVRRLDVQAMHEKVCGTGQ